MRDFATYLKKTNEARQAAPQAEPPPARGAGPLIQQTLHNLVQNMDAEFARIEQELPREIQKLVKDLSNQLKGPGGVTAQRGIGTRIANWWKNLWHGADATSNPYYYRNRLGAWGETVPEWTGERVLSIAEYRTVTELSTLLEAAVAGQGVLQIDRALDNWRDDATRAIMRYIQDIKREFQRSMQNAVNIGANYMDPTPATQQRPDAEQLPEEEPPPDEGPPEEEPPPERPSAPAPEGEPPVEEPDEEPDVPARRSDGLSPASHEEMGRHGGAEDEEGTLKPSGRASMPQNLPPVPAAGLHAPPASFSPEAEAEAEAEEEEPPVKKPGKKKKDKAQGPVPPWPGDIPSQGKDESDLDHKRRVWAWVKAAFAHWDAIGETKGGKVKFGVKASDPAGSMLSPAALYNRIPHAPTQEGEPYSLEGTPEKPTAAPPIEPEEPEAEEEHEDEGVPGPVPEGPEHTAAPGRSERYKELLSDANRPHVIKTLTDLRKRHLHTLTDEQREILDAVWHPWMSLPQDEKDHLNRKGNAGKEGRGHNAGKLRVVLPKVLRKGDPRIEIIKRYYPDIYDEYMSEHAPHLSRIEHEGDTEESVQRKIEGHFQRRPSRGKKKKPEDDPKELVSQIDTLAGEGRINAAEMEELKRDLKAGEIEKVKRLLFAGRTRDKDSDPDADLGGLMPELDKFPESIELIARYRKLLREGGKPILRSEYAHLPLSQRHEYFKKRLASD
jgi:hypothetical protein